MVKDLHRNKELGTGIERIAWGSWHTRERERERDKLYIFSPLKLGTRVSMRYRLSSALIHATLWWELMMTSSRHEMEIRVSASPCGPHAHLRVQHRSWCRLYHNQAADLENLQHKVHIFSNTNRFHSTHLEMNWITVCLKPHFIWKIHLKLNKMYIKLKIECNMTIFYSYFKIITYYCYWTRLVLVSIESDCTVPTGLEA